MDNKNTFFFVGIRVNRLAIEQRKNKSELLDFYQDSFEPVLIRMNATTESYTLTSNDPTNRTIIFLFKVEKRKRLSLLKNQVKKYITPYKKKRRRI